MPVKDFKDDTRVIGQPADDIDVKGAINIKKNYPDAIMIFIKPPSLEELRLRLINRKSEKKVDINKRLKRLSLEYDYAKKFNFIIVNDCLEETVNQIEKVVIKEKK